MGDNPSFLYENNLNGLCAGVDEVGRGPLAGPVVAAAVIIPEPVRDLPFVRDLNDSKKLSAKKREAVFDDIHTHCIVGVGMASVQEIDRINILQATFLAMKRAVVALPQKPEWLLIDGNRAPQSDHYKIKTLIKGDSLSRSVAAASIIAKVTRDRMMTELALEYPEFGWASNAGYGAASHIDAIKTLGFTPHHRRSFEPVKSMPDNHQYGYMESRMTQPLVDKRKII